MNEHTVITMIMIWQRLKYKGYSSTSTVRIEKKGIMSFHAGIPPLEYIKKWKEHRQWFLLKQQHSIWKNKYIFKSMVAFKITIRHFYTTVVIELINSYNVVLNEFPQMCHQKS